MSVYYIYGSEMETFMYEVVVEYSLTILPVHRAHYRGSHIVRSQYVFVKKSSKQSGDRSMQNIVAGEVDFKPRYVEPLSSVVSLLLFLTLLQQELLNCDLFSTCSSFKVFTLELPEGTLEKLQLHCCS